MYPCASMRRIHRFFLRYAKLLDGFSPVCNAIGLMRAMWRFFQIAPAGQDHFKQSTTRLYFIADKIIEMTMEMYQQPRAMVEALILTCIDLHYSMTKSCCANRRVTIG